MTRGPGMVYPKRGQVYTVPDVAREMHLSHQRVHQLIRLMGIRPRQLWKRGPLLFSPQQFFKLVTRDHGTPGRRRKEEGEEA